MSFTVKIDRRSFFLTWNMCLKWKTPVRAFICNHDTIVCGHSLK